MKISFAGYYKFLVIDGETMKVKRETTLEKNLITNAGLDMMGISGAYMSYCHVGSASAAPQVTDTSLQSFIASSGNSVHARGYEGSASPAYGWLRKTFTFAAGVATGNLSEVSVGKSNSNGGAFSRSLIRDNGVPITLTVSATDILQVVYELRSIVNVSDIAFNCTIAGINHSCVARPSRVNSSGYWSFWAGSTPPTFGEQSSPPAAYETDVLGAQSVEPAGSDSNGSHVTVAYVSGNYYRDFHADFTLSTGNFASGIGAIVVNLATGPWQISFTPKIQKASNRTLRVTFRVSWGRA